MKEIIIDRERCNPPERTSECDSCAGFLDCFPNADYISYNEYREELAAIQEASTQ